MTLLPSGLPEQVADHEILSRFVTQSNRYTKALIIKPAAFLPDPRTRNTSVYRGDDDVEKAKAIWNKTTSGDRELKAVAFCKAQDIRKAMLDVIAKEPPDAHANIENWPWLDSDPEIQKAKQKEALLLIISDITVVLV